ncbi:hypothetical protein [Acinetobacter equi]|uniref:Uncharacterized protein n=1 Tax=Acinetobacter equi TaxID=1324350 RepID=A0A0N9VXZ7_9GAMM|nr:hypothetical protein [Acinetobacter equi]ALH96257.1 hypothetical protein AOY20_12310 [Acinetobacter equi]
MTKSKFLKILFLGVVLLSCCFSGSYFLFTEFDIQTDFLVASAIFFIAFVLLSLYADWKEPQYLNKLEQDQKEIRIAIKTYKKSMDALFYFVEYQGKNIEQLKQDDNLYRGYQTIVRNMIDYTDELRKLLMHYQYRFKAKTLHEKAHVAIVVSCLQSLEKIHDILNKYDVIYDCLESYKFVKLRMDNNYIATMSKQVTEKLPDEMTEFYIELLQDK